MKRKNFLMVFSAAFFIALLAVATAPTAASPTNNWGVEEGETLTYKIDVTSGDHSTVYEYEVTVVKIGDLDSPTDDLEDLFYTEKAKIEGSEVFVSSDRLDGDDVFDHFDIRYPYTLVSNIPQVDPILPTDDAGPGVQGLDWADAKTDIENYENPPWDYDKSTVTEDGDKYTVEQENHGDDTEWGDYTWTRTVEWDSAKGTLESYSYEMVYDDVGLTESVEITKGSIDGGPVSSSVIAIAALGLAVLALLMILVKK